MAKSLVVGVGFHKTGTTSLGLALQQLGMSVCGHRPELIEDLLRGNAEPALKLAASFDALQDTPWPLLYREIDEAFPGSRFVLTLRDPDDWIASVQKHFGGSVTKSRQWIYGEEYGDPRTSPVRYVERHTEHIEGVRDYFRSRPSDLLEVDLTAEPSWGPLCEFLDMPVPPSPFPHANPAQPRIVRRYKRIHRQVFRSRRGA